MTARTTSSPSPSLVDVASATHCAAERVSGILGMILSLALKYDGYSLLLGGSMAVIFVLLLSILDSFNILDVMKDDDKLLSCCGVGCDTIT